MTVNPSADRPQKRPKNHEVENENVRPDAPPRPATEPEGAAWSSRSPKTQTDPGSGEAKARR